MRVLLICPIPLELTGCRSAVDDFQPDIAMDTGTCGVLDGDLVVKAVVLATTCLECGISGDGLPHRIMTEMKLQTGLDLLPRRDSQKLMHTLIELGKESGKNCRNAFYLDFGNPPG